MSPFVVDSTADNGYQASSTLSGSRFNSPLVDTPAAISVFTEAFIEDLQIQNLEELVDYTLSGVLDTGDTELGGSNGAASSAEYTVQRVRVRGLQSDQGVDQFRRIYPGDSYNTGRYEEARGPNGILFGIGEAGGIINTTSAFPSTDRDFRRIRLTGESYSSLREEASFSKVLIPKKLGLLVAGINQNNKGWQDYTWDDAQRIYGALTFRVNKHLDIRANYEQGTRDYSPQGSPPINTLGAMVYYDWSQVLPLEDLVATPANRNANAAELMTGIGSRNTNANGTTNRRFVYVTNDGAFYDSEGSFDSAEYGRAGVYSPDGFTRPEEWDAGLQPNPNFQINRPDLIPYTFNPYGPHRKKSQDFNQYSVFSDVRVNKDIFLNFAHNSQTTDILAYDTQNASSLIRVDRNTTRGVPTFSNGSTNQQYGGDNPYAGQYYIESDWRRDSNHTTYDEDRIAGFIRHDFGENNLGWLGKHQLAVIASQSDLDTTRVRQQLGFVGKLYNGNTNNPANRVPLRVYFTMDQLTNDPSSIYIPSWEDTPKSVMIDGENVGVDWVNRNSGGENTGYHQRYKSLTSTLQSSFWKNHLVTTFGFRKDRALITQYGADPDNADYGDQINRSIVADENDFDGHSISAGAVFHVTKMLDLLYNTSSNIGIPNPDRTVLPEGDLTPPPEGVAHEYGIAFHLLDNRVSGRLIHYTTNEVNLSAGSTYRNNYELSATALLAAYSDDESVRAAKAAELGWDVDYTGTTYDERSEGYELSVVANLTPQWRLSFNASKTDRRQSNRNGRVITYMGMLDDPDSPAGFTLLQNGFSDASGSWELVDASAFAPGGVIANMISLADDLGITLGDLNASNQSVAQRLGTGIDGINRNIIQNERRMGLRPYKANIFTAYDFKEGWLRGFSLGGGFAWQDKSVIGILASDLSEVYSKSLLKTNLMIRYRFNRGRTEKTGGKWSAQLNIDNVFDEHDPLIKRYTGGDYANIFELPNGWGPSVQTWQYVEGINWRANVTYEF